VLAHPLEAPIREQRGSLAGQSSTLTWTLIDRQIVVGACRDREPREEVVS